MYLLGIELLKEKYCLKKGLEIKLKPITLLVGDQGCGKSTLLKLLRDNSKIIQVNLSNVVKEKGVKTYYFDSEKMNPRVDDINNYSNPNGTSRGIGIGMALQSRFMSHGEILQEFTVNRIGQAKDCVLFLDEPESALSLRNQFKLVKEINKAKNNGVQLIIATHCLPLIESVNEVYSLEHLKWLDSKEFIKLNK